MKNYCGIIFIGSGSSWAWGATPEEAVEKTAKTCRVDWQIPKEYILNVNILDMRERDGWEATTDGIFDTDTGERIPIMSVMKN